MKSFLALLDRLNSASPENKESIERFIWESFRRDKAILALDMSGFSLSVRRDGILPYLCQIRRMQLLTEPVVRENKGDVVKYEADNMMAVFDDPACAIRAALAINVLMESAKKELDNNLPLSACIGIDFGTLLLIPGSDCFGDPVNVAYKLGEDEARAGEILITERVKAKLGEKPPFKLEDVVLSLAGLELLAFKVLGEEPA